MRKLIMLNRISLDGFFAGPNGEIDWFIHDPEVDAAVHEGGSESDEPSTLVTGRISYQSFESFWPHVAKDPNAPEGMKAMANEMAQMTKVVFSNTLKEVTWENSVLVKGDVVEIVRKLKQEKGGDMMIFGSGTLAPHLAEAGLIDDYLIVVTPVILGTGKLLFQDASRVNLKLVESRSFDSGNVLLHYRQS